MVILKRITIILVGLSIWSCQRPASETARAKIQIPKGLGSMMQSVGNTVASNMLCFAVNVKGGGLPNNSSSTCNVERGIVAGSVGEGETVTIEDLPTAKDLTFELYGLLKSSSSESCAKVTAANWGKTPDKIYFLGVANKVINPPDTNVVISVALPQASNTLLASKGMPSTCAPTVVTGASALRALSGSARLSGTTLKMYGRVSYTGSVKNLSSTSFKIKYWKASLQP